MKEKERARASRLIPAPELSPAENDFLYWSISQLPKLSSSIAGSRINRKRKALLAPAMRSAWKELPSRSRRSLSGSVFVVSEAYSPEARKASGAAVNLAERHFSNTPGIPIGIGTVGVPGRQFQREIRGSGSGFSNARSGSLERFSLSPGIEKNLYIFRLRSGAVIR